MFFGDVRGVMKLGLFLMNKYFWKRPWCWIRFHHLWVWQWFIYGEQGTAKSAVFRCRTCYKRIDSSFDYIHGKQQIPIASFKEMNHNGVDYE